jgi:hypothetical protein
VRGRVRVKRSCLASTLRAAKLCVQPSPFRISHPQRWLPSNSRV